MGVLTVSGAIRAAHRALEASRDRGRGRCARRDTWPDRYDCLDRYNVCDLLWWAAIGAGPPRSATLVGIAAGSWYPTGFGSPAAAIADFGCGIEDRGP